MQAGTAVGNLASAIGVQSGEAALVSELKAGSEAAFALLIAQYHQPIYSVIARSLQGPGSDAARHHAGSLPEGSSAASAASMAMPA